jgi:transposase-like protein
MARKQRQFTAQFKLETVLEVLKGEKPIAQICRERQVTDSLVYKWRQEFVEKAPGDLRGQSNQQSGQPDERTDCRVGAVDRATDNGKCAVKKGQQLSGSTTTEKRAVIQCLSAKAPVRELCEVFNCPRRTDYCRSVRRDDSRLISAIEQGLIQGGSNSPQLAAKLCIKRTIPRSLLRVCFIAPTLVWLPTGGGPTPP